MDRLTNGMYCIGNVAPACPTRNARRNQMSFTQMLLHMRMWKKDDAWESHIVR